MAKLNVLAMLLLSAVVARADFADDQYTDYPDVLLRIVTAAQNYKGLKSSTDGETALYLRRAEYIGPLIAPFGTVHVARLSFTRSATVDSKLPARGFTYIVFLDQDFKIRTIWTIDVPDESLSVSGTRLMRGNEIVMDYNGLPDHAGAVQGQDTVLYDDKPQPIPRWK